MHFRESEPTGSLFQTQSLYEINSGKNHHFRKFPGLSPGSLFEQEFFLTSFGGRSCDLECFSFNFGASRVCTKAVASRHVASRSEEKMSLHLHGFLPKSNTHEDMKVLHFGLMFQPAM